MPVEHRFLGLDRRTIPLTLVVLAVMLFFMVAMPAIDRSVGWDDETQPGDVIDLGSGVTFTPPVGWELTEGIRVDDEPASGVGGAGDVFASVGNGGVVVQVRRGAFEGTADDLLDQINRLRSTSESEPNRAFKVTGPRRTITTATGITGVEEAYTSASGEGRILAFALDAGEGGSTPTGVMIEIDGNHDAYATEAGDIDALVDSLVYAEPGS